MEDVFAALSWAELVSVGGFGRSTCAVSHSECVTRRADRNSPYGVNLHESVQPRRRVFPGGQLLRHFWKNREARGLRLNAQMKTVNGVLRKIQWHYGIAVERREKEREKKYDSSSSSFSSSSCSASSFDQAYSGNVAQGGTITPTQEGARKDAYAKPFFLPVLSVTQTFLRVLNNN